MIEFCKRLYSDIESNLDEWVHWNDSLLQGPDENGQAPSKKTIQARLLERKTQLQTQLDRLKQLIERREEHFVDN